MEAGFHRKTEATRKSEKKHREYTQGENLTPATEEDLRKIVVGELKPHDAPIVLKNYDPAWPELFAREAKRIRTALGERALRVEHVGSTSVPGLVAKPIIDIVLVVADSADEPTYVPALEKAGYVLRIREPDWHQHRLFKGPDTNINLHVFSTGSSEVERTILLRDWLRENREDRELYAAEKKKLAEQKWHYVQHYAEAKSRVIEAILSRAQALDRTRSKRRS
ncbi:GrpB family protein [Candidatus Bathyarchaeota archaeon]|nr:GrpB family protein [Candidatus Bathyarchaeota archaeon]